MLFNPLCCLLLVYHITLFSISLNLLSKSISPHFLKPYSQIVAKDVSIHYPTIGDTIQLSWLDSLSAESEYHTIAKSTAK